MEDLKKKVDNWSFNESHLGCYTKIAVRKDT